jgi:arabinogalactan oligomer / maltooligosaccharide transport system substrate-binding protein
MGSIEATQWLTAISGFLATFLALGALVVSLRALQLQRGTSKVEAVKLLALEQDREAMQQDRRIAQANHIAAWVTHTTNAVGESRYLVSLSNSSDAPAYNADVRLYDDAGQVVEHIEIQILPPTGKDGPIKIDTDIRSSSQEAVRRPRAAVSFTDTFGERWKRNEFGRLSPASSRIVLRSDLVTQKWLSRLVAPFLSDFAVKMSLPVDMGGEQLRRAFAEHTGKDRCADVIVGPHDWIGELLASDAVDAFMISKEAAPGTETMPPDADPVPNTPHTSVHADRAWNVFAHGNGVIGVPLTIETPILIFNKAMIDNAPLTVEEMMDAGEDLVKRHVVERALSFSHGPHGDPFLMWPLFAAAGGEAFDRDTNAWASTLGGLRTSRTLEALRRIQTLAAAHPSVFDEQTGHEEATDLFLHGRAPFIIDFGSVVVQAEDLGLQVGVAAVPRFVGVAPASGLSMIVGLMVSKDSPNHELAEDLIPPYLRNSQVAADLSRSRNAPVICGHDIEATTPVARLVLDSLGTTLPMPADVDMDSIWRALGDMFVAVCDQQDLSAAVSTALQNRS